MRSTKSSPARASVSSRWLSELYDDHGSSAFGYLSCLCDEAEAIRITQSVFVSLWTDPSLLNSCKSARMVVLDIADQHATLSKQGQTSAGLRIDEQHQATLRAAVRTLRPELRRAVLLTRFGGGSYRDVAAASGNAPAVTAAAIRAALIELERLLRADHPIAFVAAMPGA